MESCFVTDVLQDALNKCKDRKEKYLTESEFEEIVDNVKKSYEEKSNEV